MKWIGWSEQHATGHVGMDRDHEQMAALINQLADAMENNQPKALCSDLLNSFIDLTRTHFLAEEQQMNRHQYPRTREHKALHATLLKDVLAFKIAYDAGETVVFMTLLVILDSWLNRDIMAADKHLADFIAGLG